MGFMDFFACPPPRWTDGQPSACIQNRYLGNIAPITVGLVSAGTLILRRAHQRKAAHQVHEFELVARHEESIPTSRPYWIPHLSTPASIGEMLLLIADLAVGIALLASARKDNQPSYPLGSIILTFYVLLVAFVRRTAPITLRSRLQIHSALLCCAQFILVLAFAYPTVVESTAGQSERILNVCRTLFYIMLLLTHGTAVHQPCWLNASLGPSVHPASRDRSASVMSSLFFGWVESLIWKAIHAPLEASDLFFVDYERATGKVLGEYNALTSPRASLQRRLFRHFRYELLVQGAWATVMSCAVFVPAVLIQAILRYVIDGTIHRKTAWLCVCSLFVAGAVTTLADCQAEWQGRKISAKVRAILDSQIYSKVQMRKSGMENDNGNTINLVATDSEVVSEMSANLHLSWVVFPVQLTIATCLLYNIMGISGVIGVLFMIVTLPLSIFVSKREVAAQSEVLEASDSRIQSSTELINNIRTIKYCAWETPFRAKVVSKRNSELSSLKVRFLWWSISMTVFYSLPFLVTISTCFTYTAIFGRYFGTEVAFPALAVFAILRIPLNRLSDSISFLLQAHVSLTRIENFLRAEDADSNLQSPQNHQEATLCNTIRFEEATLRWPHKNLDLNMSGPEETDLNHAPSAVDSHFALHNLHIEFPDGGLTLVCGETRSGKSSLLLAVLGEMELVKGQLVLPHRFRDHRLSSCSMHDSQPVAFCAQEPWILNQSIQANVIFGLPYSATRYQSVLAAVCLERDLTELDEADRTYAGEGGSRLSGGQKQRVALARALYSNTKLVILDDCLSALDSKTAREVFFRAIRGPLMHGRTCIFATHSTELVGSQADLVILLRNGRAHFQGKMSDTAYSSLVGQVSSSETSNASATTLHKDKAEGFERLSPTVPVQKSDISTIDQQESRAEDPLLESPSANVDINYEETKFEGQVPWSKIRIYLRSMGSQGFWISVLLAFLSQQLVSLGLDLCIKAWARQYDTSSGSQAAATQAAQSSVKWYLSAYAVIGVVYMLTTFIRDAATFWGSLRASSAIYEKLLDSVLYARLSFFERVPSGQIINRFSADVGTLDEALATFSVSTVQIGLSILITIALIAFIFPVFLIPTVFILLAYFGIMHLYLSSSRDLRRIENIQKSPLYQHLNEAISGYLTIRAYGQTVRLQSETNSSIDLLNTPYLLQWAAKGWLTFRVTILSSFIQCLTGAFVVWKATSIDAGNAGLAMTYAATLSENVLWFVQIYALVQQNLNSVERILEYLGIEQEQQRPTQPSLGIPTDWPSSGTIHFSGYTTQYATEYSPVLKDITFQIPGGQRIGIIGRTGAGKSTLALALIRGVEAVSGSITIDGVDIASLPLDRLRQAVTVVPQDPQLFSGSVRENLDPLHQYKDHEIGAAMRVVQFRVHQSELTPQDEHSGDSGLQTTLALTASQLSRGQQQLLCMVRALLRNSRVLVLDETTASIDAITDRQIQSGLRASIAKGTTVIAIAHRLQTVADFDRIVVLDGGRIVTQGPPSEILSGKGLVQV